MTINITTVFAEAVINGTAYVVSAGTPTDHLNIDVVREHWETRTPGALSRLLTAKVQEQTGVTISQEDIRYETITYDMDLDDDDDT